MTSGNWLSRSPRATSAAACWIASAICGIEPADAGIHPRRRLLDEAEGVDDLDRHLLARAEREILDRTLGLRAPIGSRRGPRSGRSCRFRCACWSWNWSVYCRHSRRNAGTALSIGTAGKHATSITLGMTRLDCYFLRVKSTVTTFEPSSFTSTRLRRVILRFLMLLVDVVVAPFAWNFRLKSTAGSTKSVTAAKGTWSVDGTPPKRQADAERVLLDLQVPETVLDDDRHLVGKALGQMLRDVDARHAWS